MSTKIKIGAFGIVAFCAAAWVTWTIGVSGSDDQQRPGRGPRSITGAVAEPPRAGAMNGSAITLPPEFRDPTTDSPEANDADPLEVASGDPCREEALRQILAAMKDELERGRREVAGELQASIARCGDLAVPPTAMALEKQDVIFECCIQILASLDSERSIRALIEALSIAQLSEENALRLRQALVGLVGEHWQQDLDSALRMALRPCGRIQSAWLLGRAVPCRESVMTLIGALEEENDPAVQVAIISALQWLSQEGYPIPVDHVLRLVEADHLGISSQLSHFIALNLPWQEASKWLLSTFQERWQKAVSSGGEPIELPNVLLSGLGTVLQNGGAEAERAIVELLSSLETGEDSSSHPLQRQLILTVLGEASDGSVAAPALAGLIQDVSEDPALRKMAASVLGELAERSPIARERYLDLARSTLNHEVSDTGFEPDLRAAMNGSLPYHLACGMAEVSPILLETYRQHAESRREVLRVVEQAIQRRSPRGTWDPHLENPMARSLLEEILRQLELEDDGQNAATLTRLHRLLSGRAD